MASSSRNYYVEEPEEALPLAVIHPKPLAVVPPKEIVPARGREAVPARSQEGPHMEAYFAQALRRPPVSPLPSRLRFENLPHPLGVPQITLPPRTKVNPPNRGEMLKQVTSKFGKVHVLNTLRRHHVSF